MAENRYHYSVDVEEPDHDFKADDVRYDIPGQTEAHARERLYQRIENLGYRITCARILGSCVQENCHG